MIANTSMMSAMWDSRRGVVKRIATGVAASLLLLAAAGCKSSAPEVAPPAQPTQISSPVPTPTPTEADTTESGGNTVSGTAADQAGDSISLRVSVDQPQLLEDLSNTPASACVGVLQATPDRSIAIPIHVSMTVTSSYATSVAIGLNNFGELQSDDGSLFAGPEGLWATQYGTYPPECQGPDSSSQAAVTWDESVATPGYEGDWTAYLVLSNAISPNQPDPADAGSDLVFYPSVALSGQLAEFVFDKPAGEPAVVCSAPDPAAGTLEYVAIRPDIAVQDGCRSVDGGSGMSATAFKLCTSQYPDTHVTHPDGADLYDREASLFQICTGFGAPEGLSLTVPMRCALVAAAADAVAPSVSDDVENGLCRAADVASAVQNKDWLGPVKGYACGFFSDVFAYGAGTLVAGAASETGPAAVALGVGTYNALRAGLALACGGLLDGGSTAFGVKLEADHETHVAMDVLHKGQCLKYDNGAFLKKWSAAACPDS